MGMTSDRDWQKWGETILGVMTGSDSRGSDRDIERFKLAVGTYPRHWRKSNASMEISQHRVLDFGCGRAL